jgi:hypothetical protein
MASLCSMHVRPLGIPLFNTLPLRRCANCISGQLDLVVGLQVLVLTVRPCKINADVRLLAKVHHIRLTLVPGHQTRLALGHGHVVFFDAALHNQVYPLADVEDQSCEHQSARLVGL